MVVSPVEILQQLDLGPGPDDHGSPAWVTPIQPLSISSHLIATCANRIQKFFHQDVSSPSEFSSG